MTLVGQTDVVEVRLARGATNPLVVEILFSRISMRPGRRTRRILLLRPKLQLRNVEAHRSRGVSARRLQLATVKIVILCKTP